MLENIRLSREEDVERSKEIVRELENFKGTPEQKSQLRGELERLVMPVLNDISDEVRKDLNNLSPLFRGRLLKTSDEYYEVEEEVPERDLGRFGYPGYVKAIVRGEMLIYDSTVDEDKRKYKPYPKVKVERRRTIYLVETNREQVGKIHELLKVFWEKVRGELRHTSLDKVYEERERAKDKISRVDLTQRKKENFTQMEYDDADYIQKPIKNVYPGPENYVDVFDRFEALKKKV